MQCNMAAIYSRLWTVWDPDLFCTTAEQTISESQHLQKSPETHNQAQVTTTWPVTLDLGSMSGLNQASLICVCGHSFTQSSSYMKHSKGCQQAGNGWAMCWPMHKKPFKRSIMSKFLLLNPVLCCMPVVLIQMPICASSHWQFSLRRCSVHHHWPHRSCCRN